jgi:hypothetical protein
VSDLIAALRAKLDHIEQVARAAISPGASGNWHVGHHRCDEHCPTDPCEDAAECAADTCSHATVVGHDIHIYDEGGHGPNQAEHIALHGPAAALAMVAAHRLLLDRFEQLTNNRERMFDPSLSLQWHLLGQVVETIARGYRIEVGR